MRFFLLSMIWLPILFSIAGCNAILPRPDWQKAADEILDAEGDLVDALSGVTDNASAHAAVSNLEAKFIRATDARKSFAPFMNARTISFPGGGMTYDEFGRRSGDDEEQQVIDKFKKKGHELKTKLQSEVKRLRETPGLPIEFWKIVEYQIANKDVTILEIAANDLPGGPERLKEETFIRDLLSPENFDTTFRIELIDLWPSLSDKLDKKLHKAAPGLKRSYSVETKGCYVVYYSPIKDIKAFAAAIDIGKTLNMDEGQHLLRIQVDPLKLGSKGKSDEEVRQLDEQEKQKQRAEEQAQLDREWRDRQKQMRERERKEAGPYPSDPDYFDKLVEMMTNSDPEKKTRAINTLLKTDPSQVPSTDTKGKIARAFKTLAEDNIFDDKPIKGLVIWGGKYSVPVLLKLLDRSGSNAKKEIIASLGKLQQPEAAPALASLLSNISSQQNAYDALKEMGSVAEGAVIKVAPSDDEMTCIYALKLLGEIGTDKSVSCLRKGIASKNANVRDVAKESLKIVVARQKAEKEKETN
jgi:hypothetical protein